MRWRFSKRLFLQGFVRSLVIGESIDRRKRQTAQSLDNASAKDAKITERKALSSSWYVIIVDVVVAIGVVASGWRYENKTATEHSRCEALHTGLSSHHCRTIHRNRYYIRNGLECIQQPPQNSRDGCLKKSVLRSHQRVSQDQTRPILINVPRLDIRILYSSSSLRN